MQTRQTYFENLDGIRFVAAMMVFLSHSVLESIKLLEIQNPNLQGVFEALMNGEAGVSIFFVLSGFLITHLIMKEHEKAGRIDIGKFYQRRIVRIWPLFYFVIVFAFLFYPFTKSILGLESSLNSNIWNHIFFLSNFEMIDVLTIQNAQTEMSQNITWSVSIEEQFYLFWPLIFLLPKKVWPSIIVASIIWSVYFRYLHLNEHNLLYYHTISVIGDLAIGGILAYLIISFEKIKILFEKSNWLTHSILIALIFGVLFFENDIYYNPILQPYFRIITSILYGLFIASQALTKNDSFLSMSRYKRISSWGKMTYGIYLLHPIAILILHLFIIKILNYNYLDNFLSHFSVSIMSFFLTLVLAKISYVYFESRFLKLKKR